MQAEEPYQKVSIGFKNGNITSTTYKIGMTKIPSTRPSRIFHAMQALETLLALDFAEPVEGDAELGKQLSDDHEGVAGSALDLLEGASWPVVVSGDALQGWLAQPDDVRVEDAT